MNIGENLKMKLKKIVCIVLSSLLFSMNFCGTSAEAFFGYTHFNLGKKMVGKLDKKLSKSEENAFLSGVVYADVGRFKFDKETGIDSDSYEFVNAMKKFAKTDEEKWFVRGFEAHVLQDNKTGKTLKNIFGANDRRAYVFKCSGLDKYCGKQLGGIILYSECLSKFNFDEVAGVLEESGFKVADFSRKYYIPPMIAKIVVKIFLKLRCWLCSKEYLTTYENLIQKTYKSLKFEVSIDDINMQIGNLLGTFMIASYLDKSNMSEELVSKIEHEFEELTCLCVSKLESKN